jgi:leucyl-tRNA synthetase
MRSIHLRIGFPVIRKPMRQWMLRITAYAERLLADLDTIDWSDSLKEMQRNWIGRSEGAEVDFAIADCGFPIADLTKDIRVFTTRPDTLFGATYMVLAPEHKLVEELHERASRWSKFEARTNGQITAKQVSLVQPDGTRSVVSLEQALQTARDGQHDLIEVDGTVNPPICRIGSYDMFQMSLKQRADEILRQQSAIKVYRDEVSRKSDLERTELAKDKTGVFTGAYAVNPVHGGMIPIWIADYVLASYGTGAIMAVPAHDERDFEFATKFALPIIQVVQPTDPKKDWKGFTDEGIATNSANFEVSLDGLPTAEAKAKITAWLEAKGLGQKTINYKLRDWLFSRQRYWGEPFPIVWKRDAAGHLHHEALPESALPVLPPTLEDYKPTADGQPPLARANDWIALPDGSTRETNTMPQWAGSCWYYLRFCDAKNSERFIGKEADEYWMARNAKPGGVDLYVGGTEHAVLHLLYARFWHKVLHDLGHVSTPEPFQRLVNQGMILGPDGQKMSKSRGNVITPDSVISEYGADSLRLYEMFMGPLEQMKPWSMKGVEGVYRFLARVWRLAMEENQEGEWILSSDLAEIPLNAQQLRIAHATIKKVTADIRLLAFNTAISQMMVFTNEFVNAKPRPLEALRILLPLLSPFAPHLAEELWNRLGFAGLASKQTWPTHDESLLVENEVELAVQVNGKVRERLVISKDATKEEIEKAALASAKIQETTTGQTIVKVVVVPGKLVNIVAK